MAETSQAPTMVTVRTNGHVENVSHAEGMTARSAAQAANARVGWTTKYFVNETHVRGSHVVQPGDKVTLAPRAKNGR